MAYQTSIASLSKDLLSELFTNLDPKSISICKSVLKSWNSILSNTSFTKLYSQKRPSITGFLYQSSETYPEKLGYVSIYPHQEYVTDPPACLGFLDSPAVLKNSCNGLLVWQVENAKVFISNPLINKVVPLNWTFDFVKILACGVAFDPSISDHFKVIVLVVESTGCFQFRVFSSEGMNWSTGIPSQVPLNHALPYNSFKGVFLKGIVYWELMDNSLLSYNVSNDVNCVIKLPFMRENTENALFRRPGSIGESNGSLHYCQVFGMVLGVWEAKQMPLVSSATWAPKYRVDLCGVMKIYPEMKFLGSQALAFVDDCHRILMSIKHGIIEFSLEDNAVQKLYEARINMCAGYVQPSMFFPFVQSLALFNIRIKSSVEPC